MAIARGRGRRASREAASCRSSGRECYPEPVDSPPGRTHSRSFGLHRGDLVFFGVALVIIVLDQVTKWTIRRVLLPGESWPNADWFVRITHVTNTGAAFGILQGQTAVLVVTSILGLGAILIYYLYPPMEHGLLRVALGLQLGGAIGNLADRIRAGEVTDFIDFRHFPAFNVADSAITVGICSILVFFALVEGSRERRERWSAVGERLDD